MRDFRVLRTGVLDLRLRSGRQRRPATLLAAAILAAALSVAAIRPTTAEAARPLHLGITDSILQDNDAAIRAQWLDRTVSARAQLVLLFAGWGAIAPNPPANATDPADGAYDFQSLDAAVADATARGLEVMILVSRAPAWAEGPNRAPGALVGTWRPNPGHLGNFARAIATRYSGRFDDPNDGVAGALPTVRRWQLWAEPNLGVNLAPQFDGRRLVSADHYRAMLNAFYAGVKAVDPGNLVVTGGTSPYGDLFPRGGAQFERTQPLRFWRELLCFKGKKRKKLIGKRCPDPAHLDVISHHPINVGRPRRRARNPDDVSTPDLGKIKRVLRKAERTGRVRPKGRKPLWATELWWNSNPPAAGGVPLARHARWLEEALYLLWKQGVQAAVWFQVRDQSAISGIAVPRSGLFLQSGTAKPAYQAFRFPFVAERRNKRSVRVWGIAPAPGAVSIEVVKGGGSRPLQRVQAGANRVFVASIRLRGGAVLRAVQGSESSLPWGQK